MPSFSSPPPPVPTRLVDDPRPLPSALAPLPAVPPTHRSSPVLVPARPTVIRADSVPPPAATERVANNPPGDAIDREVFDQILELDEEGELFSKDMVDAYFDQAEKTFNDMDNALVLKNLHKLSSLGHFLKGSSAALGLTKVQLSCEHIQHYGNKEEVRDGAMVAVPEADAIVKITKSLARAREEYAEAKIWLDKFYLSYTG